MRWCSSEKLIDNKSLPSFSSLKGTSRIKEVGVSPSFVWCPPLPVSMASKLNPNVLYVAEHGEALGSPQADSERTSMVSEHRIHHQSVLRSG